MDNKNLEITDKVANLSATGAGIGLAIAATVGAPLFASALIGTAVVTGIAGFFAIKKELKD